MVMPKIGYTSVTLKDSELIKIDSLIDKENKELKDRSKVIYLAINKLLEVSKKDTSSISIKKNTK